MSEKKKFGILFGSIIGIVILFLTVYIIENLNLQKLLKDIDQKMNLEEVQIFYFSRPTCHYCILLEPITESLKEEYQLTYYDINVDDYSRGQLRKILNKFGTNVANFGTPYIVITKGGNVIGELNGYADENVVFDLFQKNGIIPENATLEFQYLDYDTFKSIWNNGERNLVMIGQTGETSVNARNILKPLIKKYSLSIAYMDIAETYSGETNSNQKYSEFLNMIGYTTVPTYPILMIIENGTVIAQMNQTDINSYETFLRTNGYIE